MERSVSYQKELAFKKKQKKIIKIVTVSSKNNLGSLPK